MARVLVIEDNGANLDLMVYLLEAFGHNTRAARDGQAGLEAAGSDRPDLIICDIHLPVLDGYGVVRRLKADPALRKIPVIAVTALAMVGDRDRVLQAGFDGYIAKPIDPEAFVSQVDPYLGRQSSIRSNFAERVPSPLQQTGNGATVLAVDNVPANLELVRSVLMPFGFRVITASGGREALGKARQEAPDLILSDVHMSDGWGFEFIRCVKADPQLASIPFVFISSSMTEEPDRSRGVALGAASYLVRPIEPEKLLAEILACLPHLIDKENCGQDSDR
jgi:two-component system cell cycle response regulator